jgi:hypothetical protein
MDQNDCQTKIKIDKLCKHEGNDRKRYKKTQNHGQQPPERRKKNEKRPTIIVKSTV